MKNHLKFAIVLIVSGLFLRIMYDKNWLYILDVSSFQTYFNINLQVFVWYFLHFCMFALLPFFFSLWKNKNLSILLTEKKEKQMNTFLLIAISIICVKMLLIIKNFFIDVNKLDDKTMFIIDWIWFLLDFLYPISVLIILILFKKNENFISFIDENRKMKYSSLRNRFNFGVVSIFSLLILKLLYEITIYRDFFGNSLTKLFSEGYFLYLDVFAFLGLIPFLWLLYKTPAFVALVDKGNGKESVKEEAFVWHFLVGLVLIYTITLFADFSPLYVRLLQLILLGVFAISILHLARKKYYLFLSSFVIFIILMVMYIGNLKQIPPVILETLH